jgi:iron complex outermembrane receptor protein
MRWKWLGWGGVLLLGVSSVEVVLAQPATEPAAAGHAAPTPPPSAADANAIEPTPPDYAALAVAPGPFISVDLERATSNVQHLGGDVVREEHALSLSDVLNARLGSVTINDVQNNPLQPDLQYRGFTASPLLGTPQGVAVYQNGVRVNEPFGDLLQWDLIPTFAVADAQLVPGTEPLYGLNALGGSLVLRMKDGFNAPGYRIEGLAGAFGRYHGTAEYGARFGDWAAYAGVSGFGEQGFRDKSQSSAQNVYADLRQRSANSEVGISATLANTNLIGNGPTPIELLRRDPKAVYTWPDQTNNRLAMLNLDAKRRVNANIGLQGSLYFRHTERDTLNGDAGDFANCPAAPGQSALLCDDSGMALRDEAGNSIPVTNPFTGANNTTHTVGDSLGGSLQMIIDTALGKSHNQLLLGSSYDGSRSQFVQRAELGYLTADRGVDASGIYLAGAGHHTDLGVQNHQLGVYVADTFSPIEPLSIHLSARLNMLQSSLDDRLGSSLTGAHHYVRINPAIGLSYRLARELTAFASYGEANRAPSAAELACADPTLPCRVPNAFVSDPPLAQVVSRSVELGLRGALGDRRRPWLRGSLAAFGTRNYDDILFVAGSQYGTGYFQNAGQTQRIGLEATLSGRVGPVGWYAGYTLLRATFESELSLPGGANPRASGAGGDDDADSGKHLDVEKGSHIPGLPTHAVKAGISVRPLPALELGIGMLAQSSQFLRGDEANLLSPLRGYVVMNAHASYQLSQPVQLFLRAQNLLNNHYDTFGVVADPSEVLPNASDPRFLGRAAPLGVFGGVIVAGSP